jgi:hypothetical protein
VPTVDLASRYEVGAVVLHSALMSGMRVAFPNTKRTWFFDVFPSIDKVSKITSPYEKCVKPVEPLWVEGAGHNDIELYNQYLDRLKKFVSVELVNWQSKSSAPPLQPPLKQEKTTEKTPKSGATTSSSKTSGTSTRTNEKATLIDEKTAAQNSSTSSSSVPPAPSPPKINEKLL